MLIVILYSYSAKAQIHETLKGEWHPLKMESLDANYYTRLIGEIETPIIELVISKEKVLEFWDSYGMEANVRDAENNIIIRTFMSEPNVISVSTVQHNGQEKFSLDHLFSFLNLMSVSRSVIDQYKNHQVLLSRQDDLLLLEIMNNDQCVVGKQLFEKVL